MADFELGAADAGVDTQGQATSLRHRLDGREAAGQRRIRGQAAGIVHPGHAEGGQPPGVSRDRIVDRRRARPREGGVDEADRVLVEQAIGTTEGIAADQAPDRSGVESSMPASASAATLSHIVWWSCDQRAIRRPGAVRSRSAAVGQRGPAVRSPSRVPAASRRDRHRPAVPCRHALRARVPLSSVAEPSRSTSSAASAASTR